MMVGVATSRVELLTPPALENDRHSLLGVTNMTRGGPRKGAGRKPCPDERKIPLAIKLDRDLFEYLATVENKTATIEDALRRSQGFKVWKRERGNHE